MNDFFEHLIHEFTLPLRNPVLIFSLILFIILLSPIVLKRLNVPGIIGLIISGVIIGPHGFNILEKTSAVELFSTIGLLYIMFIAGLELEMNDFKANKNKSLLFGFFTFIIPIVIGYPVCYYLLGYDFNASFLTASMFATHTLVAYPIVSRFGISKNQAVAVSVGGTILTDTAVLIILAVVLRNAQGNLNAEFWYKLGISLTIFAAIMFLIIPRVAKWFFSKLESEKHAHYIFVLSVVFFAAFLAEVAGVEKIIGAFVAGLALNKLIPHSSALMNRIEFIGNALFIPFFLISVGMVVDMSVILNGTTALIVAGTLTIVALIGKWVAAWFTQMVFKYTAAQRQLIFGLSSSHAAATLAIILVGYNNGILDENILNGTIILILITCVVASFATEKAARQIIVQGDGIDSNVQSSSRFSNEHILLPVANIENAEKYLDLALLIKDKKSPNPISILSVVNNDHEAERNLIRAKINLQHFVDQGSASETQVNVITTIDHNAMSGISRTAREVLSDIIIIGWPQKTAFFEKFMGEKLETILTNSDKSYFISYIAQPIISLKKIIIIAPALSEVEKGFSIWLSKFMTLSKEMSLPVILYGEIKTLDAVKTWVKRHSVNVNIAYKEFNDWEDILIIGRDITQEDLIVMVMARKGSVSYISTLDSIPSKIEKHFENNSKILVYPRQHDFSHVSENYEDITSGPISKGIETIGKGIESIFNIGKNDGQ
ncbi:MAG: cation:proton antiporter [Saprospiraceae bacterium]|jgi:Kef-type K+ transport system membrane component KefB|nr:cation:proton antiporter [Saprospiraceae bacterium]